MRGNNKESRGRKKHAIESARSFAPYLALGVAVLSFCWLFCCQACLSERPVDVHLGCQMNLSERSVDAHLGLGQVVFGAKVDWLSQHSVFPEYFRQQFYETGQLFPEFAANIGGGQNIYHFAYYGLYNPIILISYLLPFVKMSDYLMAAQILCLMAAVLLFYHWLRRRGFETGVNLGCSLMFLFAGPMIFHSYSQIMFVNYMPFLVLALMGVDRYFESDGRLLTVGTFLMIMTSFYFSIGGILVLVLYGVYRYLQKKEEAGLRVTLRGFLTDGICFLFPMLTAVLLSGILLVPTAMALIGQGRGGAKGVSLGELFLPELSWNRFFYSPYGIGLTTLVLVVLLTGLTYRNKADRALYLCTLGILLIPVFAWALNGGLYIRGKVMIPFLPLLCYMIADYLKRQKRKEISLASGAVPYLLVAFLIFVGRQSGKIAAGRKLLVADCMIMLFCYGIFWKRRKAKILLVPAVLFLTVFNLVCHTQAGRILETEFYEKITDEQIGAIIAQVEEEEEGFYRTEQLGTDRENEANLNRVWDMGQYISSVYSSTYHAGYADFRKNVFGLEEPFRNILMQSASKNPIFQRFMGVKYVVSENPVPGYEVYFDGGKQKVYVSSEALPVAYATDRVMSGEEYEKLEFPYNQLALLEYAVVDEENQGNVACDEKEITGKNGGKKAGKNEEKCFLDTCQVERISVGLSAKEDTKKYDKNNSVSETENGYSINIKQKIQAKLSLPGTINKGEILFLRFRVKNRNTSKDVAIWVNGVRNKLSAGSHIYYNENETFTYAILPEVEENALEVVLGEGDYEIADVECLIGKMSGTRQELCQSEFVPDQMRTKGNQIAGEIEVLDDGYFITSIPYDEGFEVRVDGKAVSYMKVNTAFLGFSIEKGEHKIELIYHAPGATAGKIVSVVGILLFLFVCISSKKG
ncbi:YfhO family protein [Roseburia hominis]